MSRTVLAWSMLLVLFWFVAAIAGCGAPIVAGDPVAAGGEIDAADFVTASLRAICYLDDDAHLFSKINSVRAFQEDGISFSDTITRGTAGCALLCGSDNPCFDYCGNCALAVADVVY